MSTIRLCPTAAVKQADRCEHENGAWRFIWNGYLFAFDPSTHIQKNLWLSGSGSGPKGNAERTAALRWFCAECGTVQMP